MLLKQNVTIIVWLWLALLFPTEPNPGEITLASNTFRDLADDVNVYIVMTTMIRLSPTSEEIKGEHGLHKKEGAALLFLILVMHPIQVFTFLDSIPFT